jgi:hypothetical protein
MPRFRGSGYIGALVLGLTFIAAPVRAQAPMGAVPPGLFEDNVGASEPLRAERARELDSSIRSLKFSNNSLAAVFRPDYRSVRKSSC